MSNSKTPTLAKITLDAPAYAGAVTQFKQWLSHNYKIKVNCLDTDDILIEATEDNPIHYKYEITESDIYLHAVEDGLKVNKAMITSILTSPNQSEHYNPIIEYIDALKGQYKGPSQIDYLISCLHLAEGQDAKWCSYIIRKWLYATLACLRGQRPNDVALGIVSERAGIGKTTLFSEILPAELANYSIVQLKTNNPLLRSDWFTNKIFINFDEMAAITIANENQFKQLISADRCTVRVPGTQRQRQAPRIASACFTSNKTQEQGGFLRSSDPGMLRRLAIIEIEDIEDYREKLDRRQLWAEVAMSVEGGAEFEWTQDDYKQLCANNRKYVQMTNAMRLISMYYRVPIAAEDFERKTASEVLQELKSAKRITSAMTNVDAVSIGIALNTLGFTREMVRDKQKGPRYCYKIKAI